MILTIEMEQRNFQEYYIRFVSFGGYSENVVLYSRSQFNAATYIRRSQYNFSRGIAFQMPNTRNMIVFAGTVMHSQFPSLSFRICFRSLSTLSL